VALVAALVAACGSGQGSKGDRASPSVADIAVRLRAIEQCFRTVAVDATVRIVELRGAPIEPAASATVSWRARGGRAALEVAGLDLDVPSPDGEPGAADRVRLFLPGGITETLDRRSGAFSRDQRSFVDPGALTSDVGPGEFLASFCGSYRSEIVARRRTRIAAVSGRAPRRRFELAADDDLGTQRIVFECAEEWGFLPAVASMLVREGDGWVERRRVEISAVRATRLGHAPAAGTLVAWRPDPGRGAATTPFRRLRAEFSFGVPELSQVVVPSSLAAAEPASRDAGGPASQDPLFSSGSPLAREPVTSRARDLEHFLSPLSGLTVTAFGRQRTRLAWGLPGVAGAALAWASCRARARGRRRVGFAGLVAGVGAIAWSAFSALAAVVPGDAGRYAALRASGTVATTTPPRSKALCGVDCVFLASALGRRGHHDFARLTALVRPGSQGTTLEALRIVSECLDLRPRLVNPRAIVALRAPVIAHVEPRHFVVVTPLEGGDVAVLDPGRGIVRADWISVRAALSPAAISVMEPAS
jgi:hypothetical protein